MSERRPQPTAYRASSRRSTPSPCSTPTVSPTATRSQPQVATLVRTILDHPDATEVHASFDRVVKTLETKLPEGAAHLEDAKEDLLAFSSFPRET